MSQFHFSPRENRAHEIKWYHWGEKPFAEAKKRDALILLSISGVWCHWCHVMDETSYSDPEIIEYINENFIPIRVDTDQRPDVNERYNLGGWPTTAILTPDGELLTGGTYIPPQQLKSLLEQANRLYRDERPLLEKRLRFLNPSNHRGGEQNRKLTMDIYGTSVENLKNAYDEEFAGFGRETKFPMVEALELAAHQWLNRSDDQCKEIFLQTLDAMRSGGMYDPVEGGFFRYSTTRDWSLPHFEKMLEDNSGLLKLLAVAYYHTRDESYQETIEETLMWLKKTMYLPQLGCWAGTQDADEHYYSLPLEQRKKLGPPFVDKNVYTNWNAQLADTLFYVSKVLENGELEQLALNTLTGLDALCYSPDKGYAHYYDGTAPRVYGLLADQVWAGRGFVTAYQHLGDKKFLERAKNLAHLCLEKFLAPEGGFFDIIPDPNSPGRLSVPHKDLQQNALTARWLLELEVLTGKDRYREAALEALESFSVSYREYGITASGYALAIYTALRPWLKVEITGSPGQMEYGRLLNSALKLYIPNKVAVPMVSDKTKNAKAYVCRGTQCYHPVENSRDLARLLKRLASEK